MDMATQIAEGLWNLGGGGFNFYGIEDGGRITLVDAGLRGDWGRLVRGLREAGWSFADVEAVLITHGHRDHIGEAERARRASGGRAFIHAADEPYVRKSALAFAGGVPAEGGLALGTGIFRLLARVAANAIAARSLRVPGIEEITRLEDGEEIDVPGRPTIRHTPGHTPGSSVFHLPHRKLLFSGDALVTLDSVSGRRGPRIPHRAFNFDSRLAGESLDVVEGLEAALLLPGHGDVWAGGVGAAVAIARRQVRSKRGA